MSKFIDITGQKFGRWTVLERAENDSNGRAQWLCECSCNEHTRRTVKGIKLRAGESLSCGCLQKEKARERKSVYPRVGDLTGKTFGFWTVIGPAEKRGNKKYWLCKCICGTEKEVSQGDLRNGKSKSCGCYQKSIASSNFNDISGQIFGNVLAIEPTEKRVDSKIVWKCKCLLCGNIFETSGRNLRSGDTFSCGCSNRSHGAQIIEKILKENNIQYESEKVFDSCVFPETGRKARFDFYINNKYLIEYDGEQHFSYKETINTWNNKENFEKTQERDSFKNKWCKDNHIPLIRIPYTRQKDLCLEDLLLETTIFRVV